MNRLTRGALLLLAIAGAAVLPATSEAANLLANPGFEAGGGGYTGWFTFGSGVQLSTGATDNIMRNGLAASKIYGGFNGCPLAPTFNVGGYGQAFTPTATHTYEFSGFAYMASADPIVGTNTCLKNRAIAKIVFFNAAVGGAEICSNEVVIGDGNTVVNQWKGFTVSAQAPAGALRVETLILYLQPACDPGSVFVDDLTVLDFPTPVEPNVLTNPSFTSGLAGWNGFGNALADTRSFAVRSPGGSIKLFSTFVTGSNSGIYQALPATPGSTWRFDLHALTTCQESAINGTNDNFLLAHLAFLDAGNVEIGSGDAIALSAVTPIGTWTPTSVVANAPPLTASVRAYVLFISPTNQGGAAWVDDMSLRLNATTDAPPLTLPQVLELRAPTPNPFSGSTRVDFALPREDDLSIRVLDVTGRNVTTLLQGRTPAGVGHVQWDGRRSDGGQAAPGIYQVVMRSSAGSVSRRVVLGR